MGLSVALCFLLTLGLAGDYQFSFDEMKAWSYIKALADDDMQGRKSGQPGGTMGEDYIADRFKEWGVEPAGDDGTYYQTFTIEHRHVGQGALFEIITAQGKRSFVYGDDWRVQRFSGSGGFTAEIAFLGYGIHAPDKGYDDYAGVDVKGKLVMLTAGVPPKLASRLEEEAEMSRRITAAQEQGALGMIGFPWGDVESQFFRMASTKENYRPDFVLLSMDGRVSEFIFKELPTDLRLHFQRIDEEETPQSFATGIKAHVGVDAIFDPERATRNVLGKITGSDPELQNEYVVIGAHMDHLGLSPLGEVYNGANDNASGTAVVMEIARIMRLDAQRPKRTVIFGLWAGEEQGLLGSYHYCDHPTHPIAETVMYINMDMVAHGSGKVNFRGEYYAPAVWEVIESNLPEEIRAYTQAGRGGPGGSDHTPFLAKGVPAFSVNTQGTHLKYHRTRDDSDLVKPELLKKTGDLVYAAVQIMANERGNFIQSGRQALYHFKYQTLVNHRLNTLEHILSAHGEAKNTPVDVQLAYLGKKEGLSDELWRSDLVDRLLLMRDDIKQAEGMVLYDSPRRYATAERSGQTTVVMGLKGVDSIIDHPRWTGVLVPLGVRFAVLEDPGVMFAGSVLSEKGKALLKAMNDSGMLLIVKGADTVWAEALLQGTEKPLVLVFGQVPDKAVLELVKEKNAAVGLLLTEGVDIQAYFKDLNSIKEAIGSRHVFAVNQPCLWSDAGKDRFTALTGELLKAEYDRSDFRNILSGGFLSLLDNAGWDD
jgi:hypothetical protein